MLNKREIAELEQCLTDDHVIIEVELYETNENKDNLMRRFRDGDNLSIDEMFDLPCAHPLIQAKISSSDHLKVIKDYSIIHGHDLQSLFEIENQPYLSLLIDNNNVDETILNILKDYGLYEKFISSKNTNLCVSFPES